MRVNDASTTKLNDQTSMSVPGLDLCLSTASFWPPAHVVESAWLEHGPFAFWLIDAISPRKLVELGTHKGFSYFSFCQAVERLRLSTACYAIDTWAGDEHAGFYGDEVWEQVSATNERCYAGFSTLVRALFADAVTYFGDGTIDLLHIDGRHLYEDVSTDFETWRPKLSDRAIVLFHDTNVRERSFGVWRLWEALSQKHPSFEFVNGHGLGVLAVGTDIPAGVRPLLFASAAERAAIQLAYARLGSHVSLQYQRIAAATQAQAQLTEVRRHLDARQADHDRLEAQLAQEVLAGQRRLQDAEHALALKEAALIESRERSEAMRLERDKALAAALEDKAKSDRVIASLTLAEKQAADAGRRAVERVERALQKANDRLSEVDAELARTRLDIADGVQRRASLESALTAIQNSLAWRITKPARRFGGNVPRPLRRAIRGTIFLSWWTVSLQLPRRLRQRKTILAELARQAADSPPELPIPHSALKELAARGMATQASPIEAARPADPITRLETIDIIICVHNALESFRNCLESVVRCTLPPYRMIIVDDGSDAPTRVYIDEQSSIHRMLVLRNSEPLGYTRAANIGLRASTAPWVVLLNSDTVVTPHWLDRLWWHGAHNPTVGVLGPLSNTASWQSVPHIFEGEDWAENPLPTDMTIDEMGDLVASQGRRPVALPFVNGFCYMIRREVLDTVGIFDEATFGAGYGEENDYSIRVRQAGWSLMIATDAYVHHAQSKSYSQDRRLKLAKQADDNLARKHDPRTEIWPQATTCRNSLAMTSIRARIEGAIQSRSARQEGRERFEGKRIAFILPIAERGGGGNVIFQESRALQRMGVDVTILNLDHLQNALGFVSDLKSLQFRSFRNTESLTAHLMSEAQQYDAAIATLYRSVYWLPRNTNLRLGYYVQDFEPYFFSEDDPEYLTATQTYQQFPEVRLLTKTRWNQMEIFQRVHRLASLVGPSVDVSAFEPGQARQVGEPINIVAMVRPSTPRRAPGRTVAVLQRVVDALGSRVSVTFFGSHDSELAAAGLTRPWAKNLGHLDQPALAELLSKAEIFLDCSDYQAMGLTALEAMLSGCAVVAPVRGGTNDFIRTGSNGILVDTQDEFACAEAVMMLAGESGLLEAMQLRAVRDANLYIPEASALRLMSALFDD